MQEHEVNNASQFQLISDLIVQLNECIQEIPDDQSNKKDQEVCSNMYLDTFENPQLFSPERSLDLENQVSSFYSSNKSLKLDLDHYDVKLHDLNKNIDDLKQQIFKLNNVLSGLKFKSLSLGTTSNHSSTSAAYGPMSLPILDSITNSHPFEKIKVLENELMQQETKSNKLKQQNIQLQLHNQELEKTRKRLRDTEKIQNAKILNLNSKLQSSDVVVFSSKQKLHINEFRDRLNREVDELKQQLDAVVVDTRSSISAAQLAEREAEDRVTELRRQLKAAEREATASSAHIVELETALVVATRVSPQSLSVRHQETVNRLREVVRRHESDCRKRRQELEKVRAVNQTLKEQLQQQGSTAHGPTVVHYPPGGGVTRIERTGGNVIITNEGVTITENSVDEVD